MGKKKWRGYVARILEELKTALNADYVVLGGENVKKNQDTTAENSFGCKRECLHRRLPLVVGKTKVREAAFSLSRYKIQRGISIVFFGATGDLAY